MFLHSNRFGGKSQTVIKSKNVEEREKIKEAIETQISKYYEIKVPKEVGM